MNDICYDAVTTIAAERADIGITMSSTPTGKRSHFYKACTDPKMGQIIKWDVYNIFTIYKKYENVQNLPLYKNYRKNLVNCGEILRASNPKSKTKELDGKE